MTKLIYALWGGHDLENIKGATALSAVTDAVAAAAPLRMGEELPNVLMTFRGEVPDLSRYCSRFHGWRVEERVPLPADPAHADINQGFNQVTLLNFKPGIAQEDALAHWREIHTQLAIDTQDTFYYGQNLVLEALTEGAPPIDAIVEEWFPLAAMTDPNVFFDAVGDDACLEANRQKMISSCAKFLDFRRLQVIPMEILM